MMKSTGIVRKIDDLGRIVLPKELRDMLGLESKVPLEIFVDTDRIILNKYTPSCIICGNCSDEITSINGKKICSVCMALLKDRLAQQSDGGIHIRRRS